jgi:exopolysaccharide biosynthesis polyprenyl glycosylphosphotransferase
MPEPALSALKPPEVEKVAPLGDERVAVAAHARVERASRLRRNLGMADVVAISLALLVSYLVFGPRLHPYRDLVVVAVFLPIWLLLLKVYGLYDADDKRISHSTVDDVPWVFHAVVFAALGLWTVFRAAPLDRVNLGEFIAFLVLGLTGVLVARSCVREVTKSREGPQRVLMVADQSLRRLLTRKMHGHPEYSLEPVGYLGAPGTDSGDELTCLGDLEDFEDVCTRSSIERLVVGPDLDQRDLMDLVRRASVLNVPVNLVPNLVEVLGPSVKIDDLEGVTVLGINPPKLTRSSRAIKRGMDLVIALFTGALILPLLAGIAVIVRMTSKGPALFSQERVGRNGRRFRVFKFRTMVPDAEAMLDSLRAQSADPHWVLLERDPRVTRVGEFLRKTSLDELPQLWNVIRGDMSLVGPRPLTVDDHAQVSGWGMRRLDLTPGITGVWQVLGRTRIPFEEMVKLDYLYVTNWSLWGDVRLLIRTLPSVLRRRGAN